MKTACDTNVFIKLFHNDPIVVQEIRQIGDPNVLMPSVVLMELLSGVQNKNDLQWLLARVKQRNIIHLNEAISQKSVEFLQDYRLSNGLSIPDALIGASAILNDVELYTYNLKHFNFLPGIQLRPLP
ncbi:MAG: type II toxin-antitoxin system VapC family toxin [Saprospiraceae bacterium]